MAGWEVSQFLRIMWSGVHAMEPYLEDFYFQAWLDRQVPGANRKEFAPERLREVSPLDRTNQGGPTVAPVEGLGRITLMNIRRPKPLMEVTEAEMAEMKGGSGGEGGPEEGGTDGGGNPATAVRVRRRAKINEDPVLAAHVMMEDCMHLLLDVDDLDRKVLAMDAAPPKWVLEHREALMNGLAEALQIHTSTHGAEKGDAEELASGTKKSDDMLRRICLLRKGRHVIAKALGAIVPPYPVPPGQFAASHRILWAVLRCARRIFRHRSLPVELFDMDEARVVAQEGDLVPGTVKVAEQLSRALQVLPSAADLCDALEALCAGDLVPKDEEQITVVDLLLPLRPDGDPGDKTLVLRPWLGAVLVTIMSKAEEAGADQDPRWPGMFKKIYHVIRDHLCTIAEVYKAAKESGSTEACERAMAEVPVHIVVELLQSMQAHMMPEEGETLARALTDVFEAL